MMNQRNQGSIESLYQHDKGAEQQLALGFGPRTGQVHLFSGAQFTVIDTSFLSQPGATRWSHHNPRALVEMNFVLSGYLTQSHSGLLQQQAYVAGYHNCLFNPDAVEENELISNQPFHMVSVQLERDEMMRLLMAYAPTLDVVAGQLADRSPFLRQSPVARLPQAIRYRLETVWQSPASPGLKRLHFESVVLQLLTYQFDQLMGEREPIQSASLSGGEKEKLYHAQSLLLANLSDPPRLSALAKACQLNEFSLKRGFKALFGLTVYGFVLQQRMGVARTCLLAGHKSVSEIAYELGYGHPQHFHRAFKQYYGVTPKALKLG